MFLHNPFYLLQISIYTLISAILLSKEMPQPIHLDNLAIDKLDFGNQDSYTISTKHILLGIKITSILLLPFLYILPGIFKVLVKKYFEDSKIGYSLELFYNDGHGKIENLVPHHDDNKKVSPQFGKKSMIRKFVRVIILLIATILLIFSFIASKNFTEKLAIKFVVIQITGFFSFFILPFPWLFIINYFYVLCLSDEKKLGQYLEHYHNTPKTVRNLNIGTETVLKKVKRAYLDNLRLERYVKTDKIKQRDYNQGISTLINLASLLRGTKAIYNLPENKRKVTKSIEHKNLVNIKNHKRRIRRSLAHFIYLFLLVMICKKNVNYDTFLFNQKLSDALETYIIKKDPTIAPENAETVLPNRQELVKNAEHFIDFIFESRFNVFNDYQLRLVEPPRIRQVRVRKSSQKLIYFEHSNLSFNSSYVPEYKTLGDIETGHFNGSFDAPITNDLTNFDYFLDPTSNSFSNNYTENFNEHVNLLPKQNTIDTEIYQSPYHFYQLKNGTTHHGKINSIYLPGGYYFNFGPSKVETLNAWRELTSENNNSMNWIDMHTKAIFYEMVFYNYPKSKYVVAYIAIEDNGVGFISENKIYIGSSHYTIGKDAKQLRLCEYGIMIMVFYYLYEMFRGVQEKGFIYFLYVWRLVDLFNVITSVICVYIFGFRTIYNDIGWINHLKGLPSFDLFLKSFVYLEVQMSLYAVSLFLTFLKIVELLKGNHHYELVVSTLLHVVHPFIGLFFSQLLFICAFVFSGKMIFNTAQDFRTYTNSFQTVLSYAMGAFTSTDLLDQHNKVAGYIFLMMFFAIFLLILVNFSIVILEEAFRQAKMEVEGAFKGKVDVLDLQKKRLRTFRKCLLKKFIRENEQD